MQSGRFNYAIIYLLMLTIFISSCGNTDKEIRDLNASSIGIEEARNVEINYSMAGKAKAFLTAPLMYRYQDTVPRIEFPNRIHVDFYDDTLGVESRLDAKYARYVENENKVFLKDSVRVINRKGDTLYCNQLYWDRSRVGNEFYTNDSVHIRTKTELIDGSGMESAQDFSNPYIKNPRGFVRVPASQFPGS